MLALDPGETTGYAVFIGAELRKYGQLDTSDIAKTVDIITQLIIVHKRAAASGEPPREIHVVIEDYRIYSWKSDQHKWSDLYTPRLIGVIEAVCISHKIPYWKQSAHVAKQFCTDQKLKAWGVWAKGQKHARDAIRHAIYYIVFNFCKEIGK